MGLKQEPSETLTKEMPAFESSRLRTQPLTGTAASLGARPARIAAQVKAIICNLGSKTIVLQRPGTGAVTRPSHPTRARPASTSRIRAARTHRTRLACRRQDRLPD